MQGVGWFPGTSDIYKQLLLKKFFQTMQKDPTKSSLNFALYIVNLKKKFCHFDKNSLFSAELSSIWWDDSKIV